MSYRDTLPGGMTVGRDLRTEIRIDEFTTAIFYAPPGPDDPRRPAYEAACRRAGERLAAGWRELAESQAVQEAAR